jgi:phospholipase/lecithinase/hemolysin
MKRSRPSRWRMAMLLAGSLAGTAADAAQPEFSGLVVFGDSLSDSGNAGRYSNGPVWVERIATQIGTELRPSSDGGTNFAVGGARTHGGPTALRAQADAFLRALPDGRADPDALYVVYGGGNDLLSAEHAPDRARLVGDAVEAVGSIVEDLAGAGAKNILVPNLPDIGRTPALRQRGEGLASEVRRLSQAFDLALERRLRRIEADRKARIHRLDVYALLEQVLADPAAAGFRNVTEPCSGTACATALFWDHLHPTALAHDQLAAAALQAVRRTP